MQYVIAIIVVAVIAGGIAAFIFGRRSGRQSERDTTLQKIDKVQDAQLEAANQRRDADAIVDKLHKHNF